MKPRVASLLPGVT